MFSKITKIFLIRTKRKNGIVFEKIKRIEEERNEE